MAYIIKCIDLVKDDDGTITELHCTYDPETRSGKPKANRKVKGTLHWVSAASRLTLPRCDVFDHLFQVMDPEEVPKGRNWLDNLNPKSLEALR